MMKTEAVPATVSVQGNNATYYVVPVLSTGSTTQNTCYFEPGSSKGDKWKKVSPQNLNSKAQGLDSGSVTLCQPAWEEIIAYAGLPSGQLDQTATLYAAVAKTLKVSDTLQSFFSPTIDGTMTIPVTAATARGVILVFSKTPPGGGGVTQLIASTDPEIKNGTVPIECERSSSAT